MTYIGRQVDKIFSIASALPGAAIVGQFPEFLSDYKTTLTANAAKELLAGGTEKAAEIKNVIDGFTDQSILGNIVYYAKTIDFSATRDTLSHYCAQLNFETENIVYAGIGAITAWLGYEAIKGTYKGIRAIRKNKKAKQQVEKEEPTTKYDKYFKK